MSSQRSIRIFLSSTFRDFGEERDRHPNALSCANSLAIIYSQTGRRAQAIEGFTRVLQARREVLGADHPQSQATQKRLDELLAAPAR